MRPILISKKILITKCLMIINYVLVSAIITSGSLLFLSVISMITYKIHPYLFFVCFFSIFFRVGFYIFSELLWFFSFAVMEIFQSKYIREEKCSICLENGKMIVFPCKHHFHRKCIEQWMNCHHPVQDTNCPLCRKALFRIFVNR